MDTSSVATPTSIPSNAPTGTGAEPAPSNSSGDVVGSSEPDTEPTGADTASDAESTAPSEPTLTLSSPVMESSPECSPATPEPCGVFPPENTSYQGNANISPELTWDNVPPGTQSFAVKLTDVTFGQPLWAIWNIPGEATSLPADIPGDSPMPAIPAGASQTSATFVEGDGYYGPQSPCNVYEFVLYALAIDTFTPEQRDYVTLVGDELEALGDVILGRATLAVRNFVAGECE